MSIKRSLPIVDLLKNTDSFIDDGLHQLNNRGNTISCHKGCGHCCHLLIEITWEEAVHLANWVLEQPEDTKDYYINKIKTASILRKRFFKNSKEGQFLRQPTRSSKETPDKLAHKFFYGKVKRPCPFLKDSVCQAYSVRPTACRLHLVTSPSQQCARRPEFGNGIEIPKEALQARENVESLLEDYDTDGRWGEMCIMIDAVLTEKAEKYIKQEKQYIDIKPHTKSKHNEVTLRAS